MEPLRNNFGKVRTIMVLAALRSLEVMISIADGIIVPEFC